MRIAVIHNQPVDAAEYHAAEWGVVEQTASIVSALVAAGHTPISFAATEAGALCTFLSCNRPELIFNCCESLAGRATFEMNVAAIFELYDIPFTGSSALSLGLALDKGLSKTLFAARDVPTSPYLRLEPGAVAAAPGLSFPLIVKPVTEDASIGIDDGAVVYDAAALEARVRFVWHGLALRDAYVIARVIYETSVNACFLLTEPEKLSERASTHAKQKALRNLVRAIELAGTSIFEFKAQGAEELLGNPTHQDWLKEFTSKSGREITAWTPENVQQRLEAVYVKFGHEQTRGLAFGLLMYRNASEIAHGTLFGTLFSWGAMEPSRPLKSPSDLASFRRSELRHLLKLVSFSLESVVQIIGALVNVPDIAACATAARKDYYRDRDANA